MSAPLKRYITNLLLGLFYFMVFVLVAPEIRSIWIAWQPQPDNPYANRFCEAASSGDVHEMKKLLTAHPELLEMPGNKYLPDGGINFRGLPIQFAALGGHLPAVEYLVEHGAKVDNYQYGWGGTALKLSINGADDVRMAQYLVNHGADVNVEDGDKTALYRAAEGAGPRTADFLLEHGARVNAKSSMGNTPLHIASGAISGGSVIPVLLTHHADVNARNNRGETPLHEAAVMRRLNSCRLLLAAGADVNARDFSWQTPLYYATTIAPDRDKEVADLLRKYGAH